MGRSYTIIILILLFASSALGRGFMSIAGGGDASVVGGGASGVIFEDDFSSDGGWGPAHTGGTWSESSPPTNWSSYKIANANSDLDIVAGAGQNGTPALRLRYEVVDPPGQSGAIGLGKHLTGNKSTGYSELYIRYQMKFADDWKCGDGTVDYWKWFRLHQYRPTTNINSNGENNSPYDTRYIVCQSANALPVFGCMANTNNDDSGGSAGGKHVFVRFPAGGVNSTSGHLESLSNWSFDNTPVTGGAWDNTPQGWETVEFHIKLNSGGDCDSSENGVFEMWLNGTKQTTSMTYVKKNGETKTCTALPTQTYQGGINYIKVFDNMANWTDKWGTSKDVFLDNIVISTSPIGTSYNVGD